MDKIKQLEKEWAPVKQQEAFKAGDTITVHYRISEGNKERIQQYQGVVIQRKGSGSTATFTVRKMSGSVGVERIFPVASPFLEKVEVNKHGDVNRARIFYIRERRGKSARIKEKRMSVAQEESKASATTPTTWSWANAAWPTWARCRWSCPPTPSP